LAQVAEGRSLFHSPATKYSISELREDRERALFRRALERRLQVLGWTLGLLGGTAGLVYGLWSAGAFSR
jgi:hypothetical protein